MTITLRNLLFGVVGTLSVLLLIVATMTASDAWRQRAVADHVVENNATTDLLLQSGRYLLEERDGVSAALALANAASPQALAAIGEIRAKAVQALQEAMREMEGDEHVLSTDARRWLDTLGVARDAVGSLRP